MPIVLLCSLEMSVYEKNSIHFLHFSDHSVHDKFVCIVSFLIFESHVFVSVPFNLLSLIKVRVNECGNTMFPHV